MTDERIFNIGLIICIVMVIFFFALKLYAKTISLKESEWKCMETEHTKDRDGCVVLKYIGDKI